MADPNIIQLTSIKGKTIAGQLTTSTASLLSNSSESGLLLRINTILISNVDGTNNADVTISYNTAASGAGTNYRIASTITVSADSKLVILGKDSPIYLQENKSITGLASADLDLEYIISYDELT